MDKTKKLKHISDELMRHHIPEALNVIDLLMCHICQASLSDFMSNASVQTVSQPDALCRQRAHDTR